MEPRADIAVIGLAVMGQNLILNMNDRGFTVAAYNRTVSKVDDFLNQEARGTKVIGVRSIAEMVSVLKKPRRVMLMVQVGAPVDEFIEQLLPHLEPGEHERPNGPGATLQFSHSMDTQIGGQLRAGFVITHFASQSALHTPAF